MTISKHLIISLVIIVVTFTAVALFSNKSDEVLELSKQKHQNTVSEISTPDNELSKTSLNTVTQLTLNGTSYPVSYSQIIKTGYTDNGEIYGALKNEHGELIRHPDGSVVICNGTSNSPTVRGSGLDNSSIIEKDGKIHLVSQFECHIGAMYTAELQQANDGQLSPIPNTLKFIDQSEYKGGWVHCAGMKTPWNSHLGSEELEPDARFIEENTGDNEPYYASAKHYFSGDIDKLNPYFYGWIPEVKIENGEAVYHKHYALGRASHELAYVMPDQKTVYLPDDSVNNGIYRFVADSAGDLSSGNLYALKWNQVSAEGAGEANITWIHLAHINGDEVKKLALSGSLEFSDVLEADEVIDALAGTCNESFTFVNTQTGQECLAYKDINGDAVIDDKDKSLAAAFEKRRVAAMKGATTEFRKPEGFTYNPKNNKAYLAISAISRGMEAAYSDIMKTDKYDAGGNNDINLNSNRCGAVYELSFEDDSDPMKVTRMKSLVEGIPLESADKFGNTCHSNHISNPDNITYIKDSNMLIISEDTSYHTNNILWAYDLDNHSTGKTKKRLTRIASVELDAEATAPYWHEVGGFGYLSLVSQHPMKKQSVEQSSKESSFGLIGPIPLSQLKHDH